MQTDRIICTAAAPNPQSGVSADGPPGREWQLTEDTALLLKEVNDVLLVAICPTRCCDD